MPARQDEGADGAAPPRFFWQTSGFVIKPRRHLAFSFIPMTGGMRKGRKPVESASVEGRLLSFKSAVLAISTDPSRTRIFLEPQFVQCARQRSAAQFSLSVR